MKTTKCSQCQQELAYDQLLCLQQGVLCTPCAEAHLKAMGIKKNKLQYVQSLLDPTICTQCRVDGGTFEYERIGGLPFCPQCASFVRRRPFPIWLKMAALVLLVLAVMGAVRSITYIQVRHQLNVAVRIFFRNGNIDEAQNAAHEAFRRLPESKEVSSLYNYFSGIQALRQDDNVRAVSCFNSISLGLDEKVWSVNYLKARSKMNLAFDQKKYSRAAVLAREMLQAEPESPTMLLQAASACAAQYAENGDEKLKAETLAYLAKTRESLMKSPPALKAEMEYEIKRISHRLETRQVLTHKEYEAKFGPPPARADQEAQHS